MFIYFSPVWKYCIITQERINTSFCTERGVIGHWGAHWEQRQKRNAYGIFVCNGFSFIGMVLGDWHKGRGVWGRGVFWKTKACSHSWQKIEQGGWSMREFLFVCPGENLRSFFFPFICLFPPPTASRLLPLCFPLSSHYLTKLLSPPTPQKTSLWHVTVRDLHKHKQAQVQTLAPIILPNRPARLLCLCFNASILPVSVTASYRFVHVPGLPHPLHLLSFLFLSCLSLLLSTMLFSPCALQLSGSLASGQILKDQWESSFHHLWGAHLRTPTYTHPDTHTQVIANTQAWTMLWWTSAHKNL